MFFSRKLRMDDLQFWLQMVSAVIAAVALTYAGNQYRLNRQIITAEHRLKAINLRIELEEQLTLAIANASKLEGAFQGLMDDASFRFTTDEINEMIRWQSTVSAELESLKNAHWSTDTESPTENLLDPQDISELLFRVQRTNTVITFWQSSYNVLCENIGRDDLMLDKPVDKDRLLLFPDEM